MARTHALDRWLYSGGHANWLARRINAATARLAASGPGPSQLYMLEVRGPFAQHHSLPGGCR